MFLQAVEALFCRACFIDNILLFMLASFWGPVFVVCAAGSTDDLEAGGLGEKFSLLWAHFLNQFLGFSRHGRTTRSFAGRRTHFNRSTSERQLCKSMCWKNETAAAEQQQQKQCGLQLSSSASNPPWGLLLPNELYSTCGVNFPLATADHCAPRRSELLPPSTLRRRTKRACADVTRVVVQQRC